jgi:hypothetical protein
MSGKKAKQERKQLREQGILTTSTRAGRKRLKQLKAIEDAEAEAAAMQAQMDRWNSLSEEEKWVERDAQAEESRRRVQKMETLLAIAGAI